MGLYEICSFEGQTQMVYWRDGVAKPCVSTTLPVHQECSTSYWFRPRPFLMEKNPCLLEIATIFSQERLRRVLRKKAAVILDLHTLTPADLDLHILTPADLDLHTLTSADLHHHTLTPADLDLHTLTPADLDLHTFTSADLLSLFFYSLLRRGRCRRSATKRNPFARNGRWTSKT